MPNWSSLDEIAKDGLVFNKLIHVLLGLYLWEWFTSLGFDWDYVCGKRKFRWPMIFYFLNRYCLLFALIGIAIALNVSTEVNCQALYTFNQCFGNAAIGFASVNLSLRTIAVWNQRWYIWTFLTAVIIGHFSLLLHGILLKAKWVDGIGCEITSTDSHLLAITFIYGMSFDALVLCLTAWKLLFPVGGKSRLVARIFNDGLLYFVIAFLSNLLATIFMLLDLNPVMSIIANVPAAIASTIVACRAVRRLANYTHSGAEMFAGKTTSSSTLNFRNTSGNASQRPKVMTANLKASEGGVHVQMETFESPATATDRSYLEYDAAGKLTHSPPGVNVDPEAQIVDEFKRPAPY